MPVTRNKAAKAKNAPQPDTHEGNEEKEEPQLKNIIQMFSDTSNTLLRFYLGLDNEAEPSSIDAAERWLNHFTQVEWPKIEADTDTEKMIDRRLMLYSFLRMLKEDSAQSMAEKLEDNKISSKNDSKPKLRSARSGAVGDRTIFNPKLLDGYPVTQASKIFLSDIVPSEFPAHEGVEMMDADLKTQAIIEILLKAKRPELLDYQEAIDEIFPKPTGRNNKSRPRNTYEHLRYNEIIEICKSNDPLQLARKYVWDDFLQIITNYCKTVFSFLINTEKPLGAESALESEKRSIASNVKAKRGVVQENDVVVEVELRSSTPEQENDDNHFSSSKITKSDRLGSKIASLRPVQEHLVDFFNSRAEIEEFLGKEQVENLKKMAGMDKDTREVIADLNSASERFRDANSDPLPDVLKNIEKTVPKRKKDIVPTSDTEEESGKGERRSKWFNPQTIPEHVNWDGPVHGRKQKVPSSAAPKRRLSRSLSPELPAWESPRQMKQWSKNPPGFTPLGDKSFDYRQLFSPDANSEANRISSAKAEENQPRIIRFSPALLGDTDEELEIRTTSQVFSTRLPNARSAENVPPRDKNIAKSGSPILGTIPAPQSGFGHEHAGYNPRRKRIPWSPDELNALEQGLLNYRCSHWAGILRDFNERFNACRTQVDLKDKARNEMKRRLRTNQDLGGFVFVAPQARY